MTSPRRPWNTSVRMVSPVTGLVDVPHAIEASEEPFNSASVRILHPNKEDLSWKSQRMPYGGNSRRRGSKLRRGFMRVVSAPLRWGRYFMRCGAMANFQVVFSPTFVGSSICSCGGAVVFGCDAVVVEKSLLWLWCCFWCCCGLSSCRVLCGGIDLCVVIRTGFVVMRARWCVAVCADFLSGLRRLLRRCVLCRELRRCVLCRELLCIEKWYIWEENDINLG